MRTATLAAAIVALFAIATESAPYGADPALNPVTFHRSAPGQTVVLVQAGQAKATIVAGTGSAVDKKAKQPAVWELLEHIRLATGAELPVVADGAPLPDGPLVLIGEGALTRKLGISAKDLPLEGFRVTTFSQDGTHGLAIVGREPGEDDPPKSPSGTLWGVYDVLERFVGIRWYYPDDDGRAVPEKTDIVVQPVHYTDAPIRPKRTIYAVVKGMDYRTAFRRYREGCSSPVSSTPCHSPGSWNVHKDHPETFELMADGKRHHNMPCYGNPKTAELYIADLARFYETGATDVWTHPWPNVDSAWFPPTKTLIPISPPDKGVECHCEFCKPLYSPDADRHGRASRVVAHHVRLVAEQVRKRWPDKLVWYLPYSNYTTPPPDLKLPDNVVVGLCLMHGAGNAKEPSCAARHDEWIDGWRRVTGRKVHLWEYLCWPADETTLPYQYPHVLKTFCERHRNDVDGTFINGGAGPPGLPGQYWAFQHPTLYCWFRLMWNPDFDVDAALAEYVRVMYGPASEPMGELLNLLITRWEQTPWETPPSSHHISPRNIHEETMPPGQTAELAAWLAEARELAGEGTVHRRRVEFLGNAVDMFLAESREYHSGAGLPTLPVLKSGGNPVVDGNLDEPVWADTVGQQFVHATDPKNPTPEAPTTVRGVWTENGITLAFRFDEPFPDKIRADRTARDQDVYWDDCVEVFLDTVGKRMTYHQIVVNSLGTVFDRHSQEEAAWNGEGLKTAATIGKDSWSIELFIPFAAFVEQTAPKIGDTWYANFTRSRFAGGKMQLTRWSTKHRPSNLDFSAFGKLRFVE